jgi:hypothetical protein
MELASLQDVWHASLHAKAGVHATLECTEVFGFGDADQVRQSCSARGPVVAEKILSL